MSVFNKPRIVLAILLLIQAGVVFSQSTSVVEQKFRDYHANLFQEKIFVHTDRAFYFCGETMWFRLYLTDAYTNRPSGLSKLAYVELLDDRNNPVVQAKISMKEGQDHGSMQLPLTLNTGVYILRAYTSWMKNSGPGVFFEKKITVVNSLKSSGGNRDTAASYVAGLYPEGGDLVAGLESRVAFHVSDNLGASVPATFVLLGDKGDTVAKSVTEHFGNGSFNFLPVPGRNYRAVFTLAGGQTLVKEMPPIKELGTVMRLTRPGAGKIKLLVTTNTNAQALTIFIQAHHVAEKIEQLSLVQGRAELVLDEDKLAEGISQITVFNESAQPVCERLFFRQPSSLVMATLETDSKIYAGRTRVSLSFHTGSGNPLETADLSVSVARVNDLDNNEAPDIIASTWLTSELSGEVESPSYYFQNNKETEGAADLLMLTQGWRRFRWTDIMKGPAIQYPLEYNGQVVSGRLIDAANDTVVKNVTAFLSVPGKQFGFVTARSDNQGNLAFETKDFSGPSAIIVHGTGVSDSAYRFLPSSPYSEQPPINENRTINISSALTDWLTQGSIAMQVQKIYYPGRQDLLRMMPGSDSLPFYGRPAATYLLDDYTRFTTMEEVLREYVKEVNVVARNGGLHLKVFNEDAMEFFQDNILVLIDGVPLVNHDALFNYDPLKVRRLTVIPRSYLMGPAVFSSIISLETYNGNYDGVAPLDRSIVAMDYEGIQAEREFYRPLYDSDAARASRLPDFRSTLEWIPGLGHQEQMTGKLSFYTSDMQGRYLIMLQGLTPDGKPVSGRCLFKVKNNK